MGQVADVGATGRIGGSWTFGYVRRRASLRGYGSDHGAYGGEDG